MREEIKGQRTAAFAILLHQDYGATRGCGEPMKTAGQTLDGTNGPLRNRIRAKMKRPRAFQEFRNLRVLPSGYQVSVTRGKMEFSKHFAGHSTKSLQAAMGYRDRLRRELPDKRKNIIPRRLWAALNLKRPAVGVFSHPKRRMYQVTYRDRVGRLRTRTFSWTDREAEIDSYVAAVKFRKKCLAS